MNPELVRKALEKVGNPNFLVNLLSRRVRQLNSGNRPLIEASPTLGAADIALLEIVEDKMHWETPEIPEEGDVSPRKRRSNKH